MIETRVEQSPGPLDGDGAAVLDPAAVAHWRAELSASLARASGLDDEARVDAIRALEELVCTATAAQAALSAELDASQRQEQARAGECASRRGRGVSHLVAYARRESPHRGQRHLGLARIVAGELPCTWAAWRAGRVTEWTATVIARETACLPVEHRLAVDRAVAEDPARLEAMGARELLGLLRAEAERLDPAAVVARRRRAEADRHVSLRPAPDTMTWLTALLPVKDGVAVLAALTRTADSARAAGDERSRGQLMADTLVAGVAGVAGTTGDEPAGSRVELGLVMTDAALFSAADDAAHLEGFGPIPAELAREIVAGALSRDEYVGIRRLYSCPDTGELVAMDARTRTFRGSLARFVKLRDRTCRTPWCDAPVRHVDHVLPAAAGGETSLANAQGLCEACNYAKQAPGWRVRPSPDGTVRTELPTGHACLTRPPPLATIRRARLPALHIDYLVAG